LIRFDTTPGIVGHSRPGGDHSVKRWTSWPLRAVVVAGESMTPTFRPGDCLLVRADARVRVGDVVLARHPSITGLLLVKRAARREVAGWWLSSDNAALGLDDSRAFGVLPAELVVGRVLFRYYPWRPRRRA
jgi:nickel-type superoxide dismutase maturation protease